MILVTIKTTLRTSFEMICTLRPSAKPLKASATSYTNELARIPEKTIYFPHSNFVHELGKPRRNCAAIPTILTRTIYGSSG